MIVQHGTTIVHRIAKVRQTTLRGACNSFSPSYASTMPSDLRARAAILFSGMLAAGLVVSGEACSTTNDQASVDGGSDASARADRVDAQNISPSDATVDSALPGPSIQLAAGGYTTCAIVAGVAKCWGYGEFGQLGPGFIDTNPHPTPVAIPSITFTPTMISSTYDGACVSNGTQTSCWGDEQALPTSGFGSVEAVATGSVFSCLPPALDGSVSCVGYDGIGELGPLGDGGTSLDPVPLAGVANVAQVQIGYAGGCARETDGTVWCWGESGPWRARLKDGRWSDDPGGTDHDPHATRFAYPA